MICPLHDRLVTRFRERRKREWDRARKMTALLSDRHLLTTRSISNLDLRSTLFENQAKTALLLSSSCFLTVSTVFYCQLNQASYSWSILLVNLLRKAGPRRKDFNFLMIVFSCVSMRWIIWAINAPYEYTVKPTIVFREKKKKRKQSLKLSLTTKNAFWTSKLRGSHNEKVLDHPWDRSILIFVA